MESKARLSCSLLESCEIFNALFGGITTIRNQVQSRTETIISTQEVNLDAFSPDQKHAVKQLAGLLIDMSIALPSIDAPAIETGKRHEVEKLLDEKNLLERKYKRTIAALQDYLSQELTRAEELETKLQAKEMELVNVVAERDKYLKKFQQENTGSSQAHAKATSSQTQLSHSLKSRVTETEVFNPQDWIGRYIRKGFGSNYYFGIVVHFDAPYFKVCDKVAVFRLSFLSSINLYVIHVYINVFVVISRSFTRMRMRKNSLERKYHVFFGIKPCLRTK